MSRMRTRCGGPCTRVNKPRAFNRIGPFGGPVNLCFGRLATVMLVIEDLP